jgi:uncharacterized 2Fe-2S/4Fe-4S cluster protein (DUF4445 family)
MIRLEPGESLREALFARGVEFPCGGRGRCRRCRVRVCEGSLDITPEQEQLLTPDEIAQGWRLACRCEITEAVAIEIGQFESPILADDSPFTFNPRAGHGIAVDLGTTTLVAQWLDLSDGRVLDVRSALNPQAAYGADVMTRIEVALTRDGRSILQTAIRKGVAQLVQGFPPDADMVLVGNTAMHHLYCGIDVEPLSRAPFETPDDGLQQIGRERFLPCLGGFVGSDVLAGILATRMHQSEELIGLIDLGTNGEIVIGNREHILVASTAAGPAFEGGRISMGMRAASGAISEVDPDFHCHIIGGGTPRGICGSGLVDAVAAALDRGLIRPSGRLERPIRLAGSVQLTQGDIRELQLAKAAIAAGAKMLLRGRNVSRLYLAGAFGNYINRASARRIGLLEFPLESIDPAGNTALLGAKMALFAEEGQFERIRRITEHIPLGADPEFQEHFIEKMTFLG